MADSEFLQRFKEQEKNGKHSGEKLRNILKAETAISEILNLAHSTLLKESLSVTNSKDVNTKENYDTGASLHFLGSSALTSLGVGLRYNNRRPQWHSGCSLRHHSSQNLWKMKSFLLFVFLLKSLKDWL